MTAVLAVEAYSLQFGPIRALDDVSLAVAPGEVLGLVGESGSGKTSLAYAIMRHIPRGARESGGAIRLAGQDLRALPPAAIRRIRGARIGMVFQDPNASLNPTLTLGEQVMEMLRRHKGLRGAEACDRAEAALARAGLRDPAAILRRYPHEASGGEKQRVVIAAAFAAEPECLLLDEPTTALDVITGRRFLDLFAELQAETGVAALYISHDLALVSRVAGRVAVIHRGRIGETGPTRAVFAAPADPYTQRLVAAVPRAEVRLVADEPAGAPVLTADALTIRYGASVAATGISFAVRPGEILGLVGESGSGKSTIARALVGLAAFTGTVAAAGQTVRASGGMNRAYRRAVQIVFQHPDASLNPRQTVQDILGRPFKLYGGVPDIAGLLASVGLPPGHARRRPHELSGGEKQRVAIARAFAARPALVICDEITSSLDVSVQADIVRLLLDLRTRHGTATLFITHDLNLVRQIAHRVAVMQHGTIVELAETAALGQHEYTRALLAAVPQVPDLCEPA